MSPGTWTPQREAKCTRDKRGRFVEWKGGYTKRQLTKKRNSFHGNAVHIGLEFKRQHGRTARTGEIVRTKTKAGRYHRTAVWYVKTPMGWRETGSKRRPTPARIQALCKKARTGKR